MVRVVPYTRQIKRGSRGKDVIAVKRALAKAGYMKWNPRGFTRLFGPFAVRALKRFQKANGIEPTGIYNKATHQKLSKHFDAYGASLMGYKKPGLSKVRQRILVAAMTLHNRRSTVHYTQTMKRMQIVREKMTMKDLAFAPHIWEDCSSSVTGCYYVAGAPDPNNMNYNGFGYTGTLARHGRPVNLTTAKPGDLVLYGRAAPWQHVAMYIGKNAKGQHMVWSHGSEGGPYAPVPIDYRGDRSMIRSYLND